MGNQAIFYFDLLQFLQLRPIRLVAQHLRKKSQNFSGRHIYNVGI